MNTKIKNAIEQYQCTGCAFGSDTSCYEKNILGGIGCGKHSAGTMVFPGIGRVFLGMPKGFNRTGEQSKLKPFIFEKFEGSGWEYDFYNIPVWKHLTKDGYTLVRGMLPRRNEPFLHVFLENCIDKINCQEVTEADIDSMD